MFQLSLKNKMIRDFLKNYAESKWNKLIPSLLEIAILNLYNSFKSYIFTEEEIETIILNLKDKKSKLKQMLKISKKNAIMNQKIQNSSRLFAKIPKKNCTERGSKSKYFNGKRYSQNKNNTIEKDNNINNYNQISRNSPSQKHNSNNTTFCNTQAKENLNSFLFAKKNTPFVNNDKNINDNENNVNNINCIDNIIIKNQKIVEDRSKKTRKSNGNNYLSYLNTTNINKYISANKNLRLIEYFSKKYLNNNCEPNDLHSKNNLNDIKYRKINIINNNINNKRLDSFHKIVTNKINDEKLINVSFNDIKNSFNNKSNNNDSSENDINVVKFDEDINYNFQKNIENKDDIIISKKIRKILEKNYFENYHMHDYSVKNENVRFLTTNNSINKIDFQIIDNKKCLSKNKVINYNKENGSIIKMNKYTHLITRNSNLKKNINNRFNRSQIYINNNI